MGVPETDCFSSQAEQQELISASGEECITALQGMGYFLFFCVKEGVPSSQHPQTGQLCSEQALERGTKELSREKFSIRPIERHGNKPFYTKQNDPKESKGRTPKKPFPYSLPTEKQESPMEHRWVLILW